MGVVEVGCLLLRGRVIENARLEIPVGEGLYFESAISPGFSDAHAHPQVVDVGAGGPWRDSYEWLKNRELRVDEAAIRRDRELSAQLAEATILLSLFDGVTLISLTGSLEGGIEAVRRLRASPRVVVLPTIMSLDGWSLPESVFVKYIENRHLWNGYFSLGFFVHSIRGADLPMIRASFNISRRLGLPFALHLSEGVNEVDELVEALGGSARGVVAVHCITAPEECRRVGVRIVHCPTSNLYLYNTTLGSIELFDALGSDWPLVSGTLLKTYQDAVKLHGPSLDLLNKASLGGYELYGVDPCGDLVAFDSPLEKVVRGDARPRYVFVKGRAVVEEGMVNFYGFRRSDVERIASERIRYAFEKHGL
jgi:guanine deaminase